ncbi:hypothetical protein KJ819_00220 [Patescibacteria group bacterium]|nr:hypothetical protein [Patescibacteria group bacterium]MBU1500624.1 hypothetical protein [Patescibacteria group bacterium]MBU2080533.1 hypothetical protein [Patescibacteria group bacterium]MBU2123662.1 hypothetical protein [Patescibacteria group bacterium]MBU2194518.1 hypothetical protein [Patescibacteria group bacterium]
MDDNKQSIGNITAGSMITVALLVDGLQFLLTLSVLLLPLSLLLTFLAAAGFGVWFFLLGAYSGKGAEKKALVSLVSAIAEFIPVVNALPAVTAGVVINIALSKVKDVEKKIGKNPARARSLAQARLAGMQASRARRANAAREQREDAAAQKHAPASKEREVA